MSLKKKKKLIGSFWHVCDGTSLRKGMFFHKQIPLLVQLQGSDIITCFEIWWKWQVSIENVNFNLVILTLFVWSCLLMPFSFLLLKHQYFHPFLVSFTFLSTVPFCCVQAMLTSLPAPCQPHILLALLSYSASEK